MAKTKEELKEYNRKKQREKREELKEEGIPTSSSKQVLKSMEIQKEKGLKEFKVLSVDKETEELFKFIQDQTGCKTRAETLKKALKIASKNLFC